MMRLLDNLQYKVLAVLIPDSVQQLPALFKFRLQFMDLFAKQIHGITISFIQLYSMSTIFNEIQYSMNYCIL